MIFTSPIISNASGSAGGVTFFNSRSGLTMRARAKPVNLRTTSQQTRRNNFARIVQRWNETLTPTQRQQWQDYADLTPLPNPLGGTTIVTGLNMYVRTNGFIRSVQQISSTIWIDNGPATPGLGPAAWEVTLAASEATQQLVATAVGTPPVDQDTDAFIISASRPIRSTATATRANLQVAGGDDVQNLPITVDLPFPVRQNQTIQVRTRQIKVTGQLGQPTFYTVTVGA